MDWWVRGISQPPTVRATYMLLESCQKSRFLRQITPMVMASKESRTFHTLQADPDQSKQENPNHMRAGWGPHGLQFETQAVSTEKDAEQGSGFPRGASPRAVLEVEAVRGGAIHVLTDADLC